MNTLTDNESLLLAARVELRRGLVLELRRAPHAVLSDEEGVLFAAIEMLRSRDLPESVFMLTNEHVILCQVAASDRNQATVVVAAQTPNLGLLLPELRRVAGGLAS